MLPSFARHLLSWLVFNRGLTHPANHTPDTHQKQLDPHSKVSRCEGCHTELWPLVYHFNRPGVRRTTPSPQSRRSIALIFLRWLLTQPHRCLGQMLISRHRAEISADRLCTVCFLRRDSQTTSLILLAFHRHQ